MGTIKVKDKDGNWVKLPNYGVQNFPEAPVDGKQYARSNRQWVEIETGSSIYKLPVEISMLSAESTSDEISTAIGGVNGFNDAFDAALRGDTFVIVQSDNIEGTSVYNRFMFTSVSAVSEVHESNVMKQLMFVSESFSSPERGNRMMIIVYYNNEFLIDIIDSGEKPTATITNVRTTDGIDTYNMYLNSIENEEDIITNKYFSTQNLIALKKISTIPDNNVIFKYLTICPNASSVKNEIGIRLKQGLSYANGNDEYTTNVIHFDIPDIQGGWDPQLTFTTKGDGTKFLADNGEYKEISTGSDEKVLTQQQQNDIIDAINAIPWEDMESEGTLTQEQYDSIINKIPDWMFTEEGIMYYIKDTAVNLDTQGGFRFGAGRLVTGLYEGKCMYFLADEYSFSNETYATAVNMPLIGKSVLQIMATLDYSYLNGVLTIASIGSSVNVLGHELHTTTIRKSAPTASDGNNGDIWIQYTE